MKIVAHRVRLHPDGTRTVSDESLTPEALAHIPGIPADMLNAVLAGVRLQATPTSDGRRRRSKVASGLAIALGVAVMGFGTWATASDAGAAQLLRRSPSCALDRGAAAGRTLALGSTDAITHPSCVLETATIVALRTYSSRHGLRYWMQTVEASGQRDDLSLGTTAAAAALWGRQRTTGTLRIQRFIAPGFHLTGRAIAALDEGGSAKTVDNPLSVTRPNLATFVLGFTLLLTGFVFGPTPQRSTPEDVGQQRAA
ncbi:MAG: hypothetical protein NVS4B3_01200 [Gemmatimonadaceae bacterium]